MIQSWADADWFKAKKDVPEEIQLTVFKVTGETNTDDLSPAQDAWSRPDIPLHALAMLKNPRDGITDAYIKNKPKKPCFLKSLDFLPLKTRNMPQVRGFTQLSYL